MEAQTNLESVPKTWPGAFGVFKHSKAAIGHNVWTIVGLLVGSIVISIVISSIFTTTKTVDNTALYEALNMSIPEGVPVTQEVSETSPFGNLLSFVVGSFLSVAIYKTVFAGIARQKMSFVESLKAVKPIVWLRTMGASIVVGFLLVVSFILFIIPFFFVFPRLMIVPYYIIDKDMGVFDAIKASWADSKGNVGKVYGIVGASIVFALTAILIITIPVTVYLLVAYMAAYPLLYKYITGGKKEQPVAVQA